MMQFRPRATILFMALACLLAVSGCGDDDLPDYTKDTVCGIRSATVAGVLGTHGFEITDDRRSTMPFDGAAPLDNLDGYESRTSCTVSTSDSRLVLHGELIGPGEAESLQFSARSMDHVFRHAGGLGGVRDGSSIWACGQVKVIALTRGVDPDDETLQKVLEEFADLAGCWPS